jgi:uncharacterized protein (DUF111 family)
MLVVVGSELVEQRELELDIVFAYSHNDRLRNVVDAEDVVAGSAAAAAVVVVAAVAAAGTVEAEFGDTPVPVPARAGPEPA